ncbi:glycoside hydrolase family 3 C-terminal domain-containing protein [Actinomadura sp. WMMB 499]|uniref:glycoside hydrolase family 3 C-terminal domain-containing protein n=1 Tax=Actinomadura sp. WMMB 499 TaxID=1219491 RepID=UPI0020C80D15|nr:glycoside hydrolase family 3 C-terminal domain-containing protein [Actinomadura sp. WMMB 499]
MDGLPLERKVALLSGRSYTHTEAIDEAGLPAIALLDGPNGLRRPGDSTEHIDPRRALPATCFPPAVAVASSWDAGVAARVGAAIGREARAFGVTVSLGPGVNIKRSPLCGRNFEYYSEDPLLAGVLAAAHVRALQEQGPGASVKHFAANNQETDRKNVSADVDERTLREIYLAAFERVVREARPATVMASYNRINGVHACENHWLLTEVLRDEWGFTGAVVADWGAVGDRVAALAAGLDLSMPGPDEDGDAEIVAAVRSGALDPAVVDRAAARVAALTRRAVPATVAPATGPATGPATDDADAHASILDAHHELAVELAADSAVLLRNERDVLPLDGVRTVAVIGEFAVAPRFQGGGSANVRAARVDAALDAMRTLAADRDAAVTYAPGFSLDGGGDPAALRDEAVRAARAADVAVVFAGLPEAAEWEGTDRESLALPDGQVELIRAVAAAARRTVVVLSNGAVVSLEGWHDEVDAIVEGWLLGQGGGRALADILFGVVNPSGRLAETVPLRLQDHPSFLNFPGEQGHVRYGEGVMVGYRYFATAEVPVRYPFGHGLSYTSFETRDLRAVPTGPDTVDVSVTVANTGARTGKHVVQVYVATGAGPVRRPARELRAFTKVDLRPGESTTVEFALDRRAFAYYDIVLGGWAVAPGEYTVQIGANASTVVAESAVTLTGDRIGLPLTLDSSLDDWLTHPAVGPDVIRELAAGRSEETIRQGMRTPEFRMMSSMTIRKFVKYHARGLDTGTLERLLEHHGLAGGGRG